MVFLKLAAMAMLFSVGILLQIRTGKEALDIYREMRKRVGVCPGICGWLLDQPLWLVGSIGALALEIKYREKFGYDDLLRQRPWGAIVFCSVTLLTHVPAFFILVSIVRDFLV